MMISSWIIYTQETDMTALCSRHIHPLNLPLVVICPLGPFAIERNTPKELLIESHLRKHVRTFPYFPCSFLFIILLKKKCKAT